MVPKPKKDDSKIVLRTNPKMPISIEYFGNSIVLPPLRWTVNTLNAALKVVCEASNVKPIYINSSGTLVIPLDANQLCIDVTFSENLQKLLNVPPTYSYENYEKPFDHVSFPIVSFDNVENINEEVTIYLDHNYYPNARTLIEGLNQRILRYINQKLELSNDPDAVNNIFSLDKLDNCTFTAPADCKIKLAPFLLNVLHLSNTDETNAGNVPIKLPSATRELLNVHTNIIQGHLVNQEVRSLLRVINNDANDGENVVVSFPHLQYHQLIRSYIQNIHTYITDDFTTDPLDFHKPVSYLLHFRPCPS
jgi:hypothetical protein